MRGDETQSALAKEGPRHAAPRKTLLNRIQGPAGKAMALAAMPTAVLVGMGLTPKLALADDKDLPFAPGPCVTRSDEPTPEATTPTAKPTPSAKPTATATPTPTDSPSATATPTAPATTAPTPTATPSATETGQATGQRAQDPARTTAPAPTATPTPTATPSPAKSVNPLDPLGVGDALKDLLDGPDPKPTATATATAAPKPTTAPAAAPAPTTAPTSATAPKETVDGIADGIADGTVDGAADTVAGTTKEAIEKAAEQAGATVRELPESAKGLDPKKDESIPDGAKPRFPCPEPDPEALANAELEPGIPLLPDQPWRLESTKLTLEGLKYHGIVEVKTYSGTIKKALKFTATTVRIKDLHQLTVHSEGRTGHVRSDRGSTSTIRNGTVTMYTEELKGNLFGIIPITFSPETPPPLDVPFAMFTNVTVLQAGQFGGTLKVPGLRNTIEPS